MILTVLKLKSSPVRTSALLQGLRLLMRAARAEKGFLTSGLYLEADNANAIHYEEEWRSSEDFEEQVRSPRYTRLLALMESASEQPSLEFHFVAETRGLDYVAAARGDH